MVIGRSFFHGIIDDKENISVQKYLQRAYDAVPCLHHYAVVGILDYACMEIHVRLNKGKPVKRLRKGYGFSLFIYGLKLIDYKPRILHEFQRSGLEAGPHIIDLAYVLCRIARHSCTVAGFLFKKSILIKDGYSLPYDRAADPEGCTQLTLSQSCPCLQPVFDYGFSQFVGHLLA